MSFRLNLLLARHYPNHKLINMLTGELSHDKILFISPRISIRRASGAAGQK